MQKGRFFRPVLIAIVGLSFLLILSWLPVLFRPQAALASSFVVGSDPLDGSTISVPPTRMRIFFNTPISPASTAIIYYGPEYQVMNAGHSYVANNNSRELDTPLLVHLPEGSYTVRWTGVSTTDGRATYGVIGFNIGHSSTGLPGQTILGPSTSNILPQLSIPGILTIAWDWLVMAALVLWIGILVMEGIVLLNERDGSGRDSSVYRGDSGRTTRDLREPVGEDTNVGTGLALSEFSQVTGANPLPTFTLISQVRKQSLPLQWLCLVALGVGEIINLMLRAVLYAQTFNVSGIDLMAIRELLFNSTYGHLWLARIALIGVALVLLVWAKRTDRNHAILRNPSFTRTKGKISYSIAMLMVAGLIIFTLALSEDITQLAQAHASAVILDWLFLAAQGVWFGGTAYLGFVLLPLLPSLEPELHTQSLVTLIRRSTPLLLGSISVLLVSGLFIVEVSLSSAQQLITDPFGRALLVKILLVAIMLLGSSFALFFLMPQLRRQVLLLHVVTSEMPARRTRQATLERNERRLNVSMKTLACLGVGALLCSSLMSFFAPPIVFPAISYTDGTGNNASTSTTNSQATQTVQTGNLTVQLQVTPTQVGYDHKVIVTLSDRSNRPVTDAQIHVSINMLAMDMGTASATINGGNPSYVAAFKKYETFSMPGMWNIAFHIQRPGQKPVKVSFQVPFVE